MTPTPDKPMSMPPKVLIADDELFMLRLIEASLRKGGFTVIACRTGEEALTRAHAEPPALVVLDLVMPGIDGLEVLRRLRQEPSTQDIPVIVLSGKGEAISGVEAEAAGATLFLSKPFSPTRLLGEVRRLLSPANTR